jgi:hypothetical protein
MKPTWSRWLLPALLVAVLPMGLQAQKGGTGSKAVEIGMDGGFSFGLNSPSTVSFDVPFQNVRAGFVLNKQWSLEPSVSFNYFHVSGGSSTNIALLVGAPYLLNGSTRMHGLYIRPFAGLQSASTTGAPSASSFVIGGGVGYRLPWMDRMAWRFEANFGHGFGGGDPSQLDLTFGTSFFTK